MQVSSNASRTLAGAALALAFALAGCASPRPVPYAGIASSSTLSANTQDDADRMPYSYASQADWRKYSAMMVEPVDIYRGADHQFADVSDAEKAELARYMQAQFSEKLRSRFTLVSQPAPNALRLKLTLTGAEKTSAFLGPLLHFDIAGNLYNGVQAIRGREAAMTGYVMYSVEIFDAQSNRLLKSYVTKQYPNAMNIAASFGTLNAARTGIEKGADALVAQLR